MTLSTERLRPSLHPVYARLLCAYLRKRGFADSDIFDGVHLSVDDLRQDRRFLSFEQIRRLINQSVRLTGEPWLGLEASAIAQASAHGPVSYVTIASDSIRTALQLVARFSPLRNTITTYRLTESGAKGYFQVEELFDFGEVREYVLCSMMVTFIELLETLAGEKLQGVHCHLPYPEPPWVDEYRRHFPQLLFHFSADHLTLELPGPLLDVPCITADAEAFGVALRECERLLKQQREGAVLAQIIHHHLLDTPDCYPSLEHMAERLNMSARTLMRKLSAEKTSYQALLDEVRQEVVAWYLLNSNKPVEQVAALAGYEDASNFSRAFRRWFGTTPRAFRDAQGRVASRS